MSRYIDADEIENAKFQEENLRGMGEHVAYRVGWNEAIESVLENAPSIDICFCEKCIYADAKPIADGRYWCNIHRCYMRFCSDGEREGE